MSEQETSQLPVVQSEPLTTVTVTHRAAMLIGDDGRKVVVHRCSDGGYHFEWVKPDLNNGAAMISTQVSITKEAFEATLECVFGIENTLQAQLAEAAPEAPAQ